jgi:integrase
MARKRSNGEGCISQEKSGPSKGRYRIVLTWKVGAKVERRSRTAWKMAEATATLAEMKAERDRGTILTGKLTTGQYLDHWLETLECEASTKENYKLSIDKHIKPTLGGCLLSGINGLVVEVWLKGLVAGDRTRQNCYVILNSSMSHAAGLRMISFNPCDSVAKPKYTPEEIFPFTVGEAKQILEFTDQTRWNIASVLSLMMGLRIGEILGLEWSKVDFVKRTVLIDQQSAMLGGKVFLKKPKTAYSIRTIDLTDEAINALLDQRSILMKEGNAGSPLVLPSVRGLLLSRTNAASQWWKPMLSHLQIEHRGIHHARHTFATHALLNGVPAVVVCKTMGHSRPSITLDIYGHLLREAENRAVETVAKLFG